MKHFRVQKLKSGDVTKKEKEVVVFTFKNRRKK